MNNAHIHTTEKPNIPKISNWFFFIFSADAAFLPSSSRIITRLCFYSLFRPHDDNENGDNVNCKQQNAFMRIEINVRSFVKISTLFNGFEKEARKLNLLSRNSQFNPFFLSSLKLSVRIDNHLTRVWAGDGLALFVFSKPRYTIVKHD